MSRIQYVQTDVVNYDVHIKYVPQKSYICVEHKHKISNLYLFQKYMKAMSFM